MNKTMMVMMSAALLAVSTEAAAIRRLATLTVSEEASVEFAADGAVNLKSSNTAIATVIPPDGGRSVVTGVRLGSTEVTFSDVKGPYAVMTVNVVPAYWETLTQFFEDDPEIRLAVSGDKVIITGQTSNPDTLSRVEQAVKFDESRILTQVSYSTPAVAQLVKNYLAQIGYTNIAVTCVGRNICLKGKLFDQKAIDLVTGRSKEFLAPFAGIGVNTDGLKIVKQRILLTAEFLEYNVTKARNLGIKWPTAISAEGTLDYNWNWQRQGTYDSSAGTGDILTKNNGQTIDSKVAISGVDVTINLLKKNDAAKTLYKTTLATQSGEEAEFQNGGTRTIRLQGTFSGGETKDIEWGFLVKALPVIIDATSVNLSLSLDNKSQPEGGTTGTDIELLRYQTKSKYIVRPGETIVMSGFDGASESNAKEGMPFLSHIPGIGPWLFGNRDTEGKKTEMLLVVTVNWALEDESEQSIKAREEIKAKSTDVEMP